MEIKNSLLKNLDPYRTRLDAKSDAASPRARGADDQTATVQPQGDRVSLSPTAKLHTLAHAEASQAPEVRLEKVNVLRERLNAGEYAIDARTIAEKLVENEAFLAGTLKTE